MEGSRDSRFEALGFFIVSSVREISTRRVHLNKSRVEQRGSSADWEQLAGVLICGRNVPESKRKREVGQKTSVGVLQKAL